MGYRVINGKIQYIGDFQNNYSTDNKRNVNKKEAPNFSNILKNEIDKKESFVISNHALERLKERNIAFNENDMKKINEGINKALQKGCKDSVILYKEIALVTSIKNRTVITALCKNESEGNVFTNIDSMVIL